MTPIEVRAILEKFIAREISPLELRDVFETSMPNILHFRLKGLIESLNQFLSGEDADKWFFPNEGILRSIALEALDEIPNDNKVPNKGAILKELKNISQRLEIEYGVRILGLIGSIAKDKAHIFSDIDILVQDLGGERPWRVPSFFDEINQHFGRQVDTVFLEGLSNEKRAAFTKDLVKI
ncbi:MAG: hypothetical protein AAB680_00900 [Pseudomonadota bacterium]